MARGRKKGTKVENGVVVAVGSDLNLPEEVKEAIKNIKQKDVDDYIKEHKNDPTDKRDFNKWDFLREDNVEFFDSDLSYEVTHYRPITETQGLDFDPEWFIQTRRIKEKTGKYTSYRVGSKPYRDFWSEQFRRCNEGYISHGYRITGDNYFFLNFYRLKDTSNVKVTGSGRETVFPEFFSKQYEYFHYIDLCEHTKHDVCALKARGVGFSEIAASLGVRLYTTGRGTHTVYTAYDDKYLKAILKKCWEQLEFLNMDTESGMRHVRLKYNSDSHKKASKLNKQREEYGWGSDILGLICDSPRKLRGDRVERLFFEEAGSNPVLLKTYIQSTALVEILGNKFGTRFVWGTGGDSGPSLDGLAKMFRNPEGYNILPHRHSFTKTGEIVHTGYFIPAFTFVSGEGYIDNRGVTNIEKAKAYYTQKRQKLAANPQEYLMECAEFCFTPEDALALEGDNLFNTELLAQQRANIELHKRGPKIMKGFLEYKFKNNVHSEENKEGFKWINNQSGKIMILEHPLKDETGVPFRNLYVAGIDGIDMGQKETSDKTKNPSDFCIVIKKRMRGMDPPQYVAIYKDRPMDVREAYRTALKLLEYYNCKAVLEFSKIGFKNFLVDRNIEHKWLMRRTRATLDDPNGRSNQYGVPANEKTIQHQLELIAAYIEDWCEHIWFPEMLIELSEYSYENKRHFDIVAAMGMAELADEELIGVVPRKDEVVGNQWQDIGYYYDESGVKRFGVIPSKINTARQEIKIEHDTSRIRTSRPAYN